MSRRAKLIILALFLILLGIPAVYAVLTWSIDPPLRFRCIAALPEAMESWSAGAPPEPSAPFIIEVWNPQTFPVGYYGMAPRRHLPALRRPNGYYPTMSCMMRQVRDESASSPGSRIGNGDYIPPNGVIRYKVHVRPGDAAHFEAGTVDIGYSWASRVRKMVCDLCEWGHPKLPDSWRDNIGSIYPQYGGATLENVPIKLPARSSTTAPNSSPPSQNSTSR